MNKFRHLKILITVQLVAFILLIVAITYPVDSLLDPLLQEYLLQEEIFDENLSTALLTFWIFAFILVLINLIAFISLLFKKIWAKKAYIYTTFLFLPMSLFVGATVDHAIISTLDDIMIFTSGMIVALLMYTNVYEE
ncbi:MAG: Unknown protein [uncultured Sulfurovum sp.]|uniref:Uncharacterized protein n=1 Tax=uncultured Sulfurovum sp. TaxID=269237 RepID=A0A6S6UGE5_9BACT|nr:MAG: Unknown protein [uncultured Sulfurovum sp.]